MYTALDKWENFCLVIVISSAVEFALVNWLHRSEETYLKRMKRVCFMMCGLFISIFFFAQKEKKSRASVECVTEMESGALVNGAAKTATSTSRLGKKALCFESALNAVRKHGKHSSYAVDIASRVAFPVAFLTFAGWFFAHYEMQHIQTCY